MFVSLIIVYCKIEELRGFFTYYLELRIRISFFYPYVAGTDVVTNLKLEPQEKIIDVSWTLANGTGDVDDYIVTWSGSGVATITCIVLLSASSTATCSVQLLPCTLYEVKVQPRNFAGDDIGTPGTGGDYTQPSGDYYACVKKSGNIQQYI